MGALDPETEELEAVPGNRDVLALLRRLAEPARTEYRLGAFEQHTHPDVCERLSQVGGDGRAVGAYGLCALVTRGDVVYAIGMGTGSIALRLPAEPPQAGAAREAVLRYRGRPGAELGPEWVIADAWLSEMPRAEGTALLAGWVAAARLAADA
jgi:hypothetical protein